MKASFAALLASTVLVAGCGNSGPGAAPGGSPGNPNGGASGVALDPFANADDPEKALMYRLLQVPALRAKYLGYVRDVAEKWLDWKTLGPLVEQFQSVIAADVKLDTKKLDTTENFASGVTKDRVEEPRGDAPEFGPGFGPGGPGRGGRGGFNDAPRLSIKGFADQRRGYPLAYKDEKK